MYTVSLLYLQQLLAVLHSLPGCSVAQTSVLLRATPINALNCPVLVLFHFLVQSMHFRFSNTAIYKTVST